MVDVGQIDPPSRPVRDVDRYISDELQASITADGLYHPLLVRPCGKDRFEVVAGYHRYVALKHIAAETGQRLVPCVIRNVNDDEAPLISIAENIQRNAHLDPIAEGEVYSELVAKGWSIEQVSKKIGKPPTGSYVNTRINVYNKLHPKLQKKVSDGHLSFTNAKVIAEQPMRVQLEIAQKLKQFPFAHPATISNLIQEGSGCTHACPSHCPPLVDY
jgi:ParB family chromosome partitioning protein